MSVKQEGRRSKPATSKVEQATILLSVPGISPHAGDLADVTVLYAGVQGRKLVNVPPVKRQIHRLPRSNGGINIRVCSCSKAGSKAFHRNLIW